MEKRPASTLPEQVIDLDKQANTVMEENNYE